MVGLMVPGLASPITKAKARRHLALGQEAGNRTDVPLRSPRREAEKFSSARAASTEAHSKMSLGRSWRQARPQLPSSLTGESSASPFFQALNSLMKEKPDQESEGVVVRTDRHFHREHSFGRSGVQIGFHASQCGSREATGARAFGEEIFCVTFGSR